MGRGNMDTLEKLMKTMTIAPAPDHHSKTFLLIQISPLRTLPWTPPCKTVPKDLSSIGSLGRTSAGPGRGRAEGSPSLPPDWMEKAPGGDTTPPPPAPIPHLGI